MLPDQRKNGGPIEPSQSKKTRKVEANKPAEKLQAPAVRGWEHKAIQNRTLAHHANVSQNSQKYQSPMINSVVPKNQFVPFAIESGTIKEAA
jgi:hypothetical protein